MRFWGVFQRENRARSGIPVNLFSIASIFLLSHPKPLLYHSGSDTGTNQRIDLFEAKFEERSTRHRTANFFPHLSGVSSFKGCLRLATFTTTTTQARKRLHRVHRPRFSCFGTQGVFERGHFHNFNNRSPEKQVYSWGSRPRKRILVLWRRAASRRGANLHRNLHLRRKNRPHLHLQ